MVCSDGRSSFGDPKAELRAEIEVHDDRFFSRALLGGDTGMGESYMDGDWSSPDLISAVRLAIRNAPVLETQNRIFSAAKRAFDAIEQRLLDNSVTGSVANIRAHYDLGNDFFALFLDPTLTYSCAYYSHPDDSLAEAQTQKLDRICQKLRLEPGARVLEIGTGWGSFAFHAARRYGCHVTTTTISRMQHDFVAERVSRDPLLNGQIQLLSLDYRKLTGTYDAVVSVEMFEAVGFRHYDRFFSACDRLLAPDGSMLLQTITAPDQKFQRYLHKADWTQKYIFPGSQLASISGIAASLARATTLSVYNVEDIGLHYARTLMEWRERFHANIAEVKRMGLDERFIRMWDFYLAACAASFAERYNSDVQLVLTKAASKSVRGLDQGAGHDTSRTLAEENFIKA
jgi:cyclopropane-fatty-acyl-phospholipid synthase